MLHLKSENFEQLFKQTAMPDKVQALVASTDISKGTRVLSEVPLLVTHSVMPTVAEIVDAYRKMDRSRHDAFLQLDSDPDSIKKERFGKDSPQPFVNLDIQTQYVLAAFFTNQLAGRLYPNGSRINHSCTPNIEYAWNANINRGTFHAIKEIKKDDELTISYVRGAKTKDRRQHTHEDLGFTCSYPSCQDTMEARVNGEHRTKRLSDLQFLTDQEVRGEAADWKRCEEICAAMASDLKVQGTPTREVSNLYHNAAYFSWRRGDLHHAEHWINVELGHEKVCIGTDHPDYVHGQHILAQVQTASREEKAYASAKDTRHLEELQELSKLWDQHAKRQTEPQKKTKMAEPTHDWRLEHPEKALWWANVELKRERAEHADPDHVAIQWRAEEVEFLENRVQEIGGGASGKGPYEDIAVWLDSVVE